MAFVPPTDAHLYIVNGLAPVVSWLEPAPRLSPCYQYSGTDPLWNGLSLPANLVRSRASSCWPLLPSKASKRRDAAA